MLTERDLELIEVALESAVSACGTPLSERDDVHDLAREYRTALKHVREMQEGSNRRT